jgi:ABC-2 type transport system permease protein
VSAGRVLAILTKDLRDAWRDGRIVLLLLMPIGIALLSTLGGGEDQLPTAQVAVVDPGGGGVARALLDVAGKSVQLELTEARDAATARELVAGNDAEVAIVAARTSPAQPPRAEVLVAADATPTAQSVVALAPEALARAAGRPGATQTRVQVVAPADPRPVDIVGPRAVTILFSIIILVTLVAMMVVPMQTAEELETGTYGALRLAATSREILAAKALSGYVYASAGVAVTVLLTKLEVHDPLRFSAAVFALIVTLVGFGLLIGLLIPNANAINTYGAFLLTPLVAVAIAVFVVGPGIVATVLDVVPLSQAAKLLGDSVSEPPPFGAGAGAWLVIAAWALAGHVVLARVASRREV